MLSVDTGHGAEPLSTQLAKQFGYLQAYRVRSLDSPDASISLYQFVCKYKLSWSRAHHAAELQPWPGTIQASGGVVPVFMPSYYGISPAHSLYYLRCWGQCVKHIPWHIRPSTIWQAYPLSQALVLHLDDLSTASRSAAAQDVRALSDCVINRWHEVRVNEWQSANSESSSHCASQFVRQAWELGKTHAEVGFHVAAEWTLVSQATLLHDEAQAVPDAGPLPADPEDEAVAGMFDGPRVPADEDMEVGAEDAFLIPPGQQDVQFRVESYAALDGELLHAVQRQRMDWKAETARTFRRTDIAAASQADAAGYFGIGDTPPQFQINLQALTPEQRVVVCIIRAHAVLNGAQRVSAPQEPLRLLVCGGPGTGKSFLVNALKQLLGHSLAVTATTGKAAHGIGGVTLHHLLDLEVSHRAGQGAPMDATKRQRLFARLSNVAYLLIDEVSCGSLLFLLAADVIC